jgi:hypothetical protein
LKVSFQNFLLREAVIELEEIGRGGSGRVINVTLSFKGFKCNEIFSILVLFAPTLSLLAIKKIEVKGAIQRKVVGQDLKLLYEVARSALTDHGLLPSTENEAYLSLLSG